MIERWRPAAQADDFFGLIERAIKRHSCSMLIIGCAARWQQVVNAVDGCCSDVQCIRCRLLGQRHIPKQGLRERCSLGSLLQERDAGQRSQAVGGSLWVARLAFQHHQPR